MKYELSLFLWVASIKHPQKWSIANGWRLHSPWQSLLIMKLEKSQTALQDCEFPLQVHYLQNMVSQSCTLLVLKKGWKDKVTGRQCQLNKSQPILVPFQCQPTGKGCASGVYLSNESRPSASSWCHCQPVHQMLGLPQCHLLVWQDLSLGWSP